MVIAEKRKKRPKQYKKEEYLLDSISCFFCPGREQETPEEIYRVEKKGVEKKSQWSVRVFQNKFPVVDRNKKFELKKGFLISGYAEGEHEIVVETPIHSRQFWDFNISELTTVIKVWQLRVKELEKRSKFVVLFKNHGREGGASVIHSHTQIVSYPKIPRLVKEELRAYTRYKQKNEKCAYCVVVKKEMKSSRRIYENKSFAAFCPYASRFNYEAWIFPKKHIARLTEVHEIKELAEVLRKVLKKLSKINTSYNMVLHKVPKGADFHFHIEILPRIATWAGFEFSTNEIINSVSPESAAEWYRS